MTIRIPQIQSLEETIRLYYERVELSGTDICAIFGCSRSTAVKLKRLARDRMLEENVLGWNATCVNTEAAFRAWGLDIAALEYKLQKLRRLKLVKEQAPYGRDT